MNRKPESNGDEYSGTTGVCSIGGLDHGVGHSLLLLYDVKAPNGQKSKEFKGLGNYPSNTTLSFF